MESYLLWSDTHSTYRDQRAVDLALKIKHKRKQDRTIILGDFLDFYELSDYDRSPERKYTTGEELDYANELLDAMGPVDVFLEGNHEYRLRKALANDKVSWGAYGHSVTSALRLKDRGIRFVKYGHDIRVGPVLVSHDFGPAGKTAMQSAYNIVRYNIAFAHTHRMGVLYDGAYRGLDRDVIRHVVMTCGHLSDVHQADYMKPADKAGWQLGLGQILISKTGIATCIPLPFVKNKQKRYECTVLGETFYA